MMRIRPVRAADLDKLHALALRSGIGLTTLPKDKQSMKERIALSERSFSSEIAKPGDEYYLFVLEDTDTGAICGTSALAAAVGLNQPFYTYTLGKVVHASPALKIHNQVQTLYLGNDFTGCTEICTLFLDAEYRGGRNGKLLSRSRFLFLAEFGDRFDERVIAEMRGVSDEKGYSPFWEALGKKFFSMEFPEADALCTYGNQFIAELMPHYPIYLCMLPEEARAVIGKVHPDTQPAYDMLIAEGFRYTGHVDIFDAGPSIEADVRSIRTVRKSNRFDWSIAPAGTSTQPETYLVSNTKREGYRACLTELAFDDNGNLLLPAKVVDALELQSNEPVRACKLY
ncbi:MAG: arginine N-succinyltransferase [Pseudomonadota bacterium]